MGCHHSGRPRSPGARSRGEEGRRPMELAGTAWPPGPGTCSSPAECSRGGRRPSTDRERSITGEPGDKGTIAGGAFRGFRSLIYTGADTSELDITGGSFQGSIAAELSGNLVASLLRDGSSVRRDERSAHGSASGRLAPERLGAVVLRNRSESERERGQLPRRRGAGLRPRARVDHRPGHRNGRCPVRCLASAGQPNPRRMSACHGPGRRSPAGLLPRWSGWS